MKKKTEIAAALALLGAVSALCLKAMKAVGEHMERQMLKKKFPEDFGPDETNE